MSRRHRPRGDAALTVRDTVRGLKGGKLLPRGRAASPPSPNYLFQKSRDAILRVAEKDVNNRNSGRDVGNDWRQRKILKKDRRVPLRWAKIAFILGFLLSSSADSATRAIITEFEPSDGCSV